MGIVKASTNTFKNTYNNSNFGFLSNASVTNTLIQSGLVINLDASDPATNSSNIVNITGRTENPAVVSGSWTSNGTASYFNHNNFGNNYFAFNGRHLNTNYGTIGGWVRMTVDSTANRVFWSYGSPNENGNGILLQSEASTGFTMGVSGGQSTSIGIGNTTQYSNTNVYLIGTWSPSGVKLYINGSLAASNGGTMSGFNDTYYQYFYISKENARDRGINGRMYMAHMYNRELSATEIAYNFNATRSRFGI
jgi:hypothetical protein